MQKGYEAYPLKWVSHLIQGHLIFVRLHLHVLTIAINQYFSLSFLGYLQKLDPAPFLLPTPNQSLLNSQVQLKSLEELSSILQSHPPFLLFLQLVMVLSSVASTGKTCFAIYIWGYILHLQPSLTYPLLLMRLLISETLFTWSLYGFAILFFLPAQKLTPRSSNLILLMGRYDSKLISFNLINHCLMI